MARFAAANLAAALIGHEDQISHLPGIFKMPRIREWRLFINTEVGNLCPPGNPFAWKTHFLSQHYIPFFSINPVISKPDLKFEIHDCGKHGQARLHLYRCRE